MPATESAATDEGVTSRLAAPGPPRSPRMLVFVREQSVPPQNELLPLVGDEKMRLGPRDRRREVSFDRIDPKPARWLPPRLCGLSVGDRSMIQEGAKRLEQRSIAAGDGDIEHEPQARCSVFERRMAPGDDE